MFHLYFRSRRVVEPDVVKLDVAFDVACHLTRGGGAVYNWDAVHDVEHSSGSSLGVGERSKKRKRVAQRHVSDD